MFRNIVLSILFLILIPSLLVSQKVGLVLSGGGAKGLVHIGVIKALEENNIPIDYVTGTSIGAIVGGFYAAGYSPDSIIKEFKSPDFINYYRGTIPENYVFYFKKEQDNASLIRIPVDIVNKKINFHLPTNYISAQSMDIGVCKFFSLASAKAGNNFDNLFVPFRCVASNVYYNEEYVFSKGDLGTVILASMAFPLVFKPVEIDTLLFFDGGLYNNFPIDVMRNEFNPDYIIGIVVSSIGEKSAEDDVISQISNLVVSNGQEFSVPESEGITLNFDLPKVGLLDFHKVDELVKIGYDYGLTMVDSIKKSVTTEMTKDSLKNKRKRFNSQMPVLIADEVEINGVDKEIQQYIRKAFNIIDDTMSLLKFEEKYYELISDPQINYATPTLKYKNDTENFLVSLKVKKEAPFDIHFGAAVSSLGLNQGYLGLTYKYINKTSLITNLRLNFGQLHSSGSISARWDIPFKRLLAIEFQANNSKFNFNKPINNFLLFNNQTPIISQYDRHLRLDVSMPLKRLSLLKFGYVAAIQSYKYYQTEFISTDQIEDKTRILLQSLHLTYQRNNTNYLYYPTKGMKHLVSLRYSFGKESFTSGDLGQTTEFDNNNFKRLEITAETESYFNVFKYLTIGLYGKLLYSNASFLINYTSTLISLPYCSPIIHSQMIFSENYRAYSFLCIGLRPIVPITERFNVRLEAYAFAPYQRVLKQEISPNVYKAYFSEKFRYLDFIFSANVVFNSPVGPMSVSVNHYTAEKVKTFFMLHFGYYIFNKTALEP